MREAHTIYSYIVDRDPVRFLTVSNSAFHEYYVLYAESEFNSNRVSPPQKARYAVDTVEGSIAQKKVECQTMLDTLRHSWPRKSSS